MFIHNWLYASETSYLRDMKSDYGIIPYPKYDENQDGYYTFQHDQIGLFTIPVTSTKKDMAGAVLEAMSSESSKTVVPSYYEVALKSKYSRDSESVGDDRHHPQRAYARPRVDILLVHRRPRAGAEKPYAQGKTRFHVVL